MKPPRQPDTGYVDTSPRFFRLIAVSGLLFTVLVLGAAIFLPAPLLGPADAGAPPNPAKSAWFLLWIQEVVSHGTSLVYPVLLLGMAFLLLPWLPLHGSVPAAYWLPRTQRAVNLLALATFAAIVALSPF
jgi:hypothetical protein